MIKYLSSSVSTFIIIFITFILTTSNGANTSRDGIVFHTFPDKHTLALWLFDETDYNFTTLCDASENYYDLRLMPNGIMATGKYGNSLNMSGGSGHVVSYAGFAGKVVNNHIRKPDGQISGLWGPTEGPEKLLEALAEGKWTFEFWLKFENKNDNTTIFDMGYGYDAGFSLILEDSGNFKLTSSYSGISARILPDIDVIKNHNWYHLAFSQSGSDIKFFIDGIEQSKIQLVSIDKQPLPDIEKPENREHEHRNFESMSYEERRKNRFNLTIGHPRSGGGIMSGSVDEMRFSDIVRYTKDFNPSSSFSRKSGAYGAIVSKPVVSTGLHTLFGDDKPEIPLQFGLRKYVFIDDEIIDSASGVDIRMNQPVEKQKTDFKPEKSAWRPTVVDIENKVYLYVPEGYDSELGRTFLYTSNDGIHFTEHEDSPVIKDLPLYGTFFEDKNPNILPEEKYKLTSWIGNRGINLFFSPDGIHWRRNETLILPLVSGGSAESYYDDQRGCYSLFIRRDSSFRTSACPGGVRQCIMFETNEPTKTWPFNRLDPPYFEGWTLPAVTCEGPAIFDETVSGQAYRSRAIKYPWAPDVYLSFVWRYPSDEGDDPARHVDLGVSRDGKNWRFFEPTQGWYIPGTDDPDPEQLSIYGLIRRGDEIWQYTNHGGPHGGSPQRTYYRWKQRVDGFVSLDGSGFVITKPLVFTGDNVKLLLNSTGSVKVAILDEKGREYPEYSISKCEMSTESIAHLVIWSGVSDISIFSGKPIRLKFELSGSKLFAFELTGN
jgi:hypothetical protein